MHKSLPTSVLFSSVSKSGRLPQRTFVSTRCSTSVGDAKLQNRKTLKDTLKRAVANTKRGKNTTPQQQAYILQTIEQLEAGNPTKNPALSGLLSGKWSLLYTGPGRAGDVDWEKRTGGVEGPFLAFFRPLTANAVRSRGITQIISSRDGSVQNLAEFRVANAVNGALNVAGTVDPVRNSDGEAVRVDVKFTSFSLKLGSLPQLKIPLTWPKTPLHTEGMASESQNIRFSDHRLLLRRLILGLTLRSEGFVDTTYLDEDFRVGRGDKGSVFVTARK